MKREAHAIHGVLALGMSLSLARQIYNAYYEVSPDRGRRSSQAPPIHRRCNDDLVSSSIGVAINRDTYRGKLLFSNKPILLPQECLVTRVQIESQRA